MPKPLFGDNGSGMHTHSSLWKDGKPLFAGDKYAGLSELALVLHRRHPETRPCADRHLQSDDQQLQAFGARVSRRRLTWPILHAIGRPRFAFRPIPPSPKAKRVEYRTPDPAATPYLAFSALLLAGLDGIQNRIDPGDPLDKNLYELPPEELAKVPTVPDSLLGAIEALEKDHEFLLKGDVFTKDFLDNWVELKRKEYDALRLRPHPYEFFMYFDL